MIFQEMELRLFVIRTIIFIKIIADYLFFLRPFRGIMRLELSVNLPYDFTICKGFLLCVDN
jgi:hypothetical protein